MRVFNLTKENVEYRGKTIPAEGSLDFPQLSFIPDRDRELEGNKVLAFGQLPRWYTLEREVQQAMATMATQPEVLKVAVLDDVSMPVDDVSAKTRTMKVARK